MNELQKYVISLAKGKTVSSMAYITGLPKYTIQSMLRGDLPASYEIIKNVIENCGGTEEHMQKIIKDDYLLLHQFWDYVYPENAGINCLGIVLRKFINESNISRKEILEKTGFAQSRLSNMELGKVYVPFKTVEQISDIINVPLSCIYDELLNIPFDSVSLQMLCYRIKQQRKRLALSVTTVSTFINVTYDRYLLFEAGKKPISYDAYNKLAERLELGDAYRKSLENYSFFSELLPEKQTPKNSLIFKLFKKLASYDYLVDTSGNRYISKYVYFIIAAALFNDYMGVNKKELIIKCLGLLKNGKDEVISEKELAYGLDIMTDSYNYIYKRYMKENGYTSTELARRSGYSLSYISSAPKHPNIKYMVRVCDIIGIPFAAILEYDYYHNRSKKADEISIDKIRTLLKSDWNLYDIDIPAELIKNIFELIISDDTSSNIYDSIMYEIKKYDFSIRIKKQMP